MSGPLDGRGGCGHLFFGIDKRQCRIFRVADSQFLRANEIRQRLQPPLPGDGSLGPAFRLVGEIKVLQFRFLPGRLNACSQFRRQFSLFLYGFEDGDFPFFQFPEIGEPFLYFTNLYLVEFAGLLLPITGDKGHRRSFAQQFHGMVDLKWLEAGFLDDVSNNAGDKLVR